MPWGHPVLTISDLQLVIVADTVALQRKVTKGQLYSSGDIIGGYYPTFPGMAESRIWILTHLPLVPHICVTQWTGWALVQVMACRLFGAKPEPMLVYCHLDSWEQISVKFESELKKMYLKMTSARMAVILSRGRWVKYMYHGSPVCIADHSMPISRLYV